MDEEQHAFITYTSLKEAQTAARGTNSAILHDGRITAKVEGCSNSLLIVHTVKVENLAGRTSEETLEEVFGFHEDVDVLGITIKTPAVGPNYAYIYYSNEQDAQRAVSELNGTKIDESVVQVKLYVLNEKLEVDCESLIVRIITSPDRPEYKSQFQSIERANLVMIKPMKNEQGFDLKGNAETLEVVKTHLELVISKLQERLEDEQFTLPYSCASSFADQEVQKQITKIERKHSVEFCILNNSRAQLQESVKVSEFSLHMSAQLKAASQQDISESAVTVSERGTDILVKEEIQTQLNLRVQGFKENLAQAIVGLKTIFL